MTGSLWTLWSSIKEVKAPFIFDREHGIALHAMQGNQASSRCEGEVSWFFSSCCGNLGYILELRRGWPFKTGVCSVMSGHLASCEAHLGILLEAWQHIRDACQRVAGDQESLSICPRDIGIPISFQEKSGIVSFLSTELRVPVALSRNGRTPVVMRQGSREFSRVSTGDVDISFLLR